MAGALGRPAMAVEELALAVLVALGGRLVEAASEVPGLEMAEPSVPLVFLLVGTNPPVLALGAVVVDLAIGFETALLASGIAGDEGVLRLLPLTPVVKGLSEGLAAGDEAKRGSRVDGAGTCGCQRQTYADHG